MEYGIYSNDDNINKAISEALEGLNNLFFIEDSNSEDEQESNLISIEDEIPEFDDNIHLNKNKFEFIETPNSFIEDEVFDELKLKIKKFFEERKCSCHSKQPCFEQIGYERFLMRRSEFEGLDKKMRDMVVKGQLMAFQKDENTK